MLTKKEYVDKYGNTVVDYRITKGDTFILNVEVLDDNAIIKQIDLKIGDYDYIEIMSKQFEYLPEQGKYSVTLTSEETDSLTELETYRYQILVEHTTGKIETVMSGKLVPTYAVEPEEEK
jgi:hypothetical protein